MRNTPPRNTTRRMIFTLCLCAAMLCAFAAGAGAHGVSVAVAQKAIKKDEARKLIAAASIFALNKEAVTIREISPPGAGATVLVGVKLGFHFVKDAAGGWRVVEVRTGDRQWESFELLARALGGEATTTTTTTTTAAMRAELDNFAAELAALVKNKGANKGAAASGAEQRQPNGKDENASPKELRRGALSVSDPAAAFAPVGSSVVVELEVETSVDFERDARGRWQVARIGVGRGGSGFEAFEAFERALAAEKIARARADLESLAAALEAYRAARGFYVVGETASDLVNHLNPRHTAAFVRFDPWHRPYEYEGTRERFLLRSLGADGKANTADDVTIRKG